MPGGPKNLSEFAGVEMTDEMQAATQEVSPLTDNIAFLATLLDVERKERQEERFRWVCITALLTDVVAAVALNGSWTFIPLFMLQLVVLIGFARVYGVDWAEVLIGKLLFWIGEKFKP